MCAVFRDVQEVAQGRVWLETVEGYRVPYEYYATVARLRFSSLRDTSALKLGEDNIDRYGSPFRKEKAEARTLVAVTETRTILLMSII